MAGIFALVRSNWRGETAKLRNKEWFPCLFAVLDALAQPSGATAILSFFAAGWCRLPVVQTCMYIYIYILCVPSGVRSAAGRAKTRIENEEKRDMSVLKGFHAHKDTHLLQHWCLLTIEDVIYHGSTDGIRLVVPSEQLTAWSRQGVAQL